MRTGTSPRHGGGAARAPPGGGGARPGEAVGDPGPPEGGPCRQGLAGASLVLPGVGRAGARPRQRRESQQPPCPRCYSPGRSGGMNIGLKACDVAEAKCRLRGCRTTGGPSTVVTQPGRLRDSVRKKAS